MSINDGNSLNPPNGPRKYHRLAPISTLTTPPVPKPASQEGYTLLSPITLRDSIETSCVLSGTLASHQVTIDTSRSILPTPPPSARFSESFDIPDAPSNWRLRSAKISEEEKLKRSLKAVDRLLEDLSKVYEIDSLGEFLRLLFYFPSEDTSDHRSPHHIACMTSFLSGKNSFRPLDLITAIYNHRYSFPSWNAVNIHEREYAFSTEVPLDEIHFAQPALSLWAAQVVGEEVYREVGKLANDKNNRIRARMKGRG
jgi:hypothetical protein